MVNPGGMRGGGAQATFRFVFLSREIPVGKKKEKKRQPPASVRKCATRERRKRGKYKKVKLKPSFTIWAP